MMRRHYIDLCLKKLEAIRVPKVVQVIDALPRTFNGKVIKRKLKEM